MSIIPHPLPITEGKVYKTKKNKNKHISDEEAAIRELEAIISVKNRRPCDCEGQEHPLVANCLSCGRIVCTAEGPGHCLTCGNLILNKDQKSRLQEHINLLPGTADANIHFPANQNSRESRIIDNQFNYFSMGNQKWLSRNDRQALRQEMDELQAGKYKRKLVLNVDIDNMIGGADSMPQIEDFEARVRNLQLKSEKLPGGCSTKNEAILLRDVVASEALKSFKFCYISKEERDGPKAINQKATTTKKARNAKSSKGKLSTKDSDKSTLNRKSVDSISSKSGNKNLLSHTEANRKNNAKKTQNEKIITPTKLPNAKKKFPTVKQTTTVSTVKNVWKENSREQPNK